MGSIFLKKNPLHFVTEKNRLFIKSLGNGEKFIIPMKKVINECEVLIFLGNSFSNLPSFFSFSLKNYQKEKFQFKNQIFFHSPDFAHGLQTLCPKKR